MSFSSSSIGYYDQNASAFFAGTVAVNMSSLYGRFLATLPKGSHVLDAGCGSGRDSRYFHEQGYRVTAFDGSAVMAQLASEYAGVPVACRTFEEVSEVEAYEGIWACASLLHISPEQMSVVMTALWRALKPQGVLYCSFKYGLGVENRGGRTFTHANEELLESWLSGLQGVKQVESWQTQDQRPDRAETWLNALIYRDSA